MFFFISLFRENSLRQENISEEDYKRAQQVLDTFSSTSLGDYHDLYLKTDVMLLVDVFNSVWQRWTHTGEPAHYYTLPGYSWNALLKSTWVSLELITDPDKYFFIEKGLRGGGGISMVSVCHAQANNRYMQNYDPEKPTSFRQYLDANNFIRLFYEWTNADWRFSLGGLFWKTIRHITRFINRILIGGLPWLSHEQKFVDKIKWRKKRHLSHRETGQ